MTNADAVSLVDLPAMMLAEVEKRKAESGNLKFETGKPYARISMPSVVRWPQQCDREWRGVRTKTRKLVLNTHSAGSTRSASFRLRRGRGGQAGPADGAPWLFFDLENDPHELRNLASDATRAREMAELRALIGDNI